MLTVPIASILARALSLINQHKQQTTVTPSGCGYPGIAASQISAVHQTHGAGPVLHSTEEPTPDHAQDCCGCAGVTKFRATILVIATIMGVLGFCFLVAGGMGVVRVSLTDAQNDGTLAPFMSNNFLNCRDVGDFAQSSTNGNDTGNAELNDAAWLLCMGEQSPWILAVVFAASVSLIAVVAGLVSGFKNTAASAFLFTVFGSLAVALLVLALTIAIMYFGMFRIKWDKCEDFQAADWSSVAGGWCYNNSSSAVKSWIDDLNMFFAGAVLSALAQLIFITSLSCTRKTSSGVTTSL
jgi:hypothetical protein